MRQALWELVHLTICPHLSPHFNLYHVMPFLFPALFHSWPLWNLLRANQIKLVFIIGPIPTNAKLLILKSSLNQVPTYSCPNHFILLFLTYSAFNEEEYILTSPNMCWTEKQWLSMVGWKSYEYLWKYWICICIVY